MSNEADVVGLQPCVLKRDFTASTETHGRRRSSSDARRSSHSKMFSFISIRANTFSVPDLVLQLEMLIVFAPCRGTNVKIGVPENYDGIFPWYLTKVIKDILFFSWITSCVTSVVYHLSDFFTSSIFIQGLRCARVLLSSSDFNWSVHVAF